MELSTELLSQFAKITKDTTDTNTEKTVYGTAKVIDADGEKTVRVILDGSDIQIPVQTTVDVANNNRVAVLIKDHTATITGNLSAPSARNEALEDLAGKTITADILNAETARIETLIVENYATIEELNATNAKIDNLDADYVSVEEFEAVDATIKNLGTSYANIDFTNIGQAAMAYFYSQSGLIKDVTVGNQTITGKLAGVTISGDLIEGNTVKAEKLVIKGEDGLYYKLNVDALGETTASTDEKYQNGLDGSAIIAKSITATKISVNDLVAFDATIGGFNITDNSLYSGVKESVDNTTRGIYLDKDGQMAIGDSNNYFKYYRDTDGSYKIAISAVDNMNIGGRNLLRNTKTFTVSSGNSALQTDTYNGFGVRYLDCTSLAADTYRDFSQFSGAITPESGAQYTFSFYAKGTKIRTHLYDGSFGVVKTVSSQGVTQTKRDGQMDFTLTNEWKRYWVTYTLETTNTLGTSGNKNVLFRLYGGNTAYICGCMFEKSNKASDWSPAPEDVQNGIDEAGRTATNFLNFDSTWGLEVGNRMGGVWSGFRAQIRNAAFNILEESGAVIASYGAKLIELGKSATDAVIKFCGGKGQINYDDTDDCLQLTADNVRLKGTEMASLYSNYTDSNGIFRNGAVHASPGNVQITAGGGSDNSNVHVNPTNIQMATKNFYLAGVLNDSTNGGVYVAVNDGTSGIWTFRQYSNGMVELWGTYNISNMDCTTAMGSMYRTAVFNPTAFPFTVYEPNLTYSYESDGYGAFLWPTTTTTTAKPPSFYLVRATSATIVKGEINFHVHGRWRT